MHADYAIIKALGGPAKVAALLKLRKGGTQRVSNWRKRGIPAHVKLEWPHLFLRPVKTRAKKESPTTESQAA